MADTRKKEFKKCGVCGDHALGSNFNAVTCESCKAFFRRNALKTKDFKCPFHNNCEVDVITRRFCQKCRLKKCFNIGMKKEWIMTDEEKKAKKRKIERNRLKKSGHPQQPDESLASTNIVIVKAASPDSMLNNILLSPSPLTPQTPGNNSIIPDQQKTRLFSHQPLTPSDYEYSPPAKAVIVDSSEDETIPTQPDTFDSVTCASPDPAVTSKIKFTHEDSLQFEFSQNKSFDSGCGKSEELISSSSNVINVKSDKTGCRDEPSCSTSQASSDDSESVLPDSVYAKAVTLEFTELPIRTNTNQCRQLCELERMRIEELVIANAVLKMPLACGINDPSLIDVINMTDHAIRRLIKMSKKIVAFKNLCQNDQIALLKGGCTELMILRSVMTYDPEKECWRGPHGPKRMSIKMDVLKAAKGNIYEEHKRFINSFQPHWRTDENIMLILSGIALFTPERPNTLHKDVIKLEQDTYYYLLRRYLQSIYSACEARSSYLKLIHKIQELHILNENHVRVYLDVNPKEVEPLLIEIFDLKH